MILVSRVSVLKGGEVSIVLRFGLDERERAQRLTPGTLVEIMTAMSHSMWVGP